MVRLGHPARVLPQVMCHSIDHLMTHSSDDKLLANDIRKELEQALTRLETIRHKLGFFFFFFFFTFLILWPTITGKSNMF